MAKKDTDRERFENLLLLALVGAFLTGFSMGALLNLFRPKKTEV
jgi:hypothetical protein